MVEKKERIYLIEKNIGQEIQREKDGEKKIKRPDVDRRDRERKKM